MRITKESEYALRILVCLAKAGKQIDAGTIASSTSVPIRFTSKILRKLRDAGLVATSKGATGGYRLADEPEKITMLSAIEAIDGPVAISLCLADDYTCNHPDMSECGCFFHGVFDRINEKIISELSSTTIAMAITTPSAPCTGCHSGCAGCQSHGTCHHEKGGTL